MEKEKKVWISSDNPSIQRIEEKCIDCGVCKNTCLAKTGIIYNKEEVSEPICVNCGGCIQSCPTGALTCKYDYKKVLNYINDTDKTVVISVAPAVRVAIGEEFGYSSGAFLEGKLVAALKKLGFSYVFDVTFGADLTIIEEANEFIGRLKKGKSIPQFTSCCPSWVKYCELYHPELLNNLSTTKSPVAMQASIIRTYFRRLYDIDPSNIINVIVVPCVAKKYEIRRPEVQGIDFAITTNELSMMIRESNIDFNSLEDSNFDSLMAKGSGSGLLFGSTGGVMEAVLRTTYQLLNNSKIPSKFLNYQELRTMDDFKKVNVNLGDYKVTVGVVNGLINFEKNIDEIKQCDFVEVMTCKGGCIGGGGQPLVSAASLNNVLCDRQRTLHTDSDNNSMITSLENNDIRNVYKIFLEYPESDLSKSLLHTTYKQINIFKK